MKPHFRILLYILIGVSLNQGIIQAKKPKPAFVLIETQYGNMKVELYEDTPLHQANFLKLVKAHFYDDLKFHRVIDGFMIQGGDETTRLTDSTTTAKHKKKKHATINTADIPAEIVYPEHFHKKGALAAARLGDMANPQRNSSYSQFYIVQGKTYTEKELKQTRKPTNPEYTEEQIEAYTTRGGTPHLDGEYTVFGEVIEGLNVIDSIAKQPTNNMDCPIQDIRMKIKKVRK